MTPLSAAVLCVGTLWSGVATPELSAPGACNLRRDSPHCLDEMDPVSQTSSPAGS